MPELPEVETTCRGLAPIIIGQQIKFVNVRQRQLRYLIDPSFEQRCHTQTIKRVYRRAKYLIIELDDGYLLLHLGMSGHLSVEAGTKPAAKHTHVEFCLSNDSLLRFTDPRRFGLIQWSNLPLLEHPLLSHLGPEPLSIAFNADYLLQQLSKRSIAIKKSIMDNCCVVGVGNIYAQESLFLANIHPLTPSKEVTTEKCALLVETIKAVLTKAINQGGTTLRDFLDVEGKPGYFSQALYVYGRANLPCLVCDQTLIQLKIDNRTTVYCPSCQSLP